MAIGRAFLLGGEPRVDQRCALFLSLRALAPVISGAFSLILLLLRNRLLVLVLPSTTLSVALLLLLLLLDLVQLLSLHLENMLLTSILLL